MKKMAAQSIFEKFRLVELEVPLVDQNLQRNSHLNLKWGEKWCRSWDHFRRIWRFYNTNKYTKICGRGSYKNNESR
jgi:hypothetical protein